MTQNMQRRLLMKATLALATIVCVFGFGIPDASGQKGKKRPNNSSNNAMKMDSDPVSPVVASIERNLKPIAELERELGIEEEEGFLSISRSSGVVPGSFSISAAKMEAYVSRDNSEERVPLTAMPVLNSKDVVKIRIDEATNIHQDGVRWTLFVAFYAPNRPLQMNEQLQEIKLFENDGWYDEHKFRPPSDQLMAFVLLVPDDKMKDQILKQLKGNSRVAFANLGEFAITLTKERSKLERAIDLFQKVMDNRPSESDSKGWEASILRVINKAGIELPSNWKDIRDDPSLSWAQRLQKLIDNHDPRRFDLAVSGALFAIGGESVNLAINKLAKRYPGMKSEYVLFAIDAINVISRIIRRKNRPLVLLPTVFRNTSDTIVEILTNRPPTAVNEVTATTFVPFRLSGRHSSSKKITLATIPCMGAGSNLLGESSSSGWVTESSSRDFVLTVRSLGSETATEFPLEKNLGLRSWSVGIANDKLHQLSRKNDLFGRVTGKYGFDSIESDEFPVTFVSDAKWELNEDEKAVFVTGGSSPQKTISIKARGGETAKCIERISYFPKNGDPIHYSTGADTNRIQFSRDNKTASISIDVSGLQVGDGQLRIQQVGETESASPRLELKLYPEPPSDLELIYRKGDDKAELKGNRLDQVKAVKIDGLQTEIRDRTERSLTLTFKGKPRETGTYSLILEDNREYSNIVPNSRLQITTIAPPLRLKPSSGEVFTGKFPGDAVPHLDLENIQLLPTSVDRVTIQVSHDMSEYGFVANQIDLVNIRIKGQSDAISLDRDEKHLTVFAGNELEITVPLSLMINGVELRNTLAGQKLEFEIVDKVRGSSGWKTVEPAFVNLPRSLSVICPAGLTERCRLGGDLRMVASYRPDLSGEFTTLPSNSGSSISIGPLSDLENFYIKVRGFDQQPIRVVNVRRESSP